MNERWREPCVPLSISFSDEAIITGDGRIMRQPRFELKQFDIERMRVGYLCMKCLRVFPEAWPKKCPDCGAPIAREQAAYFAREYDPQPIRLGPSTSLEYERERLIEQAVRKENSNGK